MKKFVFVLAALAVAAVACEKPEPEVPDTTPAELLSFKILAADNEGLDVDYVAETIEQSMVIRIPGGGQGKTLKATLTAGENDEIKVNDVAVVDGKASFDATYPVDIVVTNTKSKKSAQYEVKIGKILQLVSKLIGTLPASEGMVYTSSSYKTAVNPTTGELWVVYTFTPSGGVKNFGVKKFSEGAFVQVGKEGIVTGESTVAVSTVYSLVFDASGTPYILYKAGDVANLMSVRKFNGTDWVLVGNAGFGQRQASIGIGPQLYFDANGNPGVVYTLDRRNTTSAYANEICYLDGNEWKSSSITGFPAYDGSSAGIFYSGTVVKMNGKAYGMVTANQYGLYVYELSGPSWSTLIVDNYKADGEDYMNPGNFSIAEKDGKILLLGTLSKTKQDQLFAFDGTSFKPYGDPFDVSVGWSSLTNAPSEAHMGVNPVNGQIVVVKCDADDYPMYSIMNENLQWEEFVFLGTATKKVIEADPAVEGSEPEIVYEHDIPAAYGRTCSLAFDKAGNILVIYPNSERKESGFPLYSIGLEDDVLPE
jgi:hypothetical protein